MKPVIVTAATSGELALLIASLEGRERFHACSREAFRGEIQGWPVIAAVTGIGKVNTAAVVSSLLERFKPELLINTGCAGAYLGSGLAVGDLAMASSEVFGDEGVLVADG
ncbi:MAG: futalosine hydrolase, partial [Geobacter sp.]